MKEYVLGFVFTADLKSVVLIKKNRPEWQKDKYNGIGGKVEDSDRDAAMRHVISTMYHEHVTVSDVLRHAMSREFKEEAGVKVEVSRWEYFARLDYADDADGGGPCTVHCFSLASFGVARAARTAEDQTVELVRIDDLKGISMPRPSFGPMAPKEYPTCPNVTMLIDIALSEFSFTVLRCGG